MSDRKQHDSDFHRVRYQLDATSASTARMLEIEIFRGVVARQVALLHSVSESVKKVKKD